MANGQGPKLWGATGDHWECLPAAHVLRISLTIGGSNGECGLGGCRGERRGLRLIVGGMGGFPFAGALTV